MTYSQGHRLRSLPWQGVKGQRKDRVDEELEVVVGGVEAKMLDDGALWTREEITLSKVSCSKLATNKVSRACRLFLSISAANGRRHVGCQISWPPSDIRRQEWLVMMRMMTDDDGSIAVIVVVL